MRRKERGKKKIQFKTAINKTLSGKRVWTISLLPCVIVDLGLSKRIVMVGWLFWAIEILWKPKDR